MLAVEDTSTTGGSVLTAVEALREAGAEVVGVAVIVDRDTGARERVEAAGLPYRYAIDAVDLGLAEPSLTAKRPVGNTLDRPGSSRRRSRRTEESRWAQPSR